MISTYASKYMLPVVNILIVTESKENAMNLIRFWLSIPNNTTSNDINSKVFWVDNSPIQINMSYCESDKIYGKYHAVVRFDSNIDVSNIIDNETYFCDIVSKDPTSNKILFDMTSNTSSILDTITKEAYKIAKTQSIDNKKNIIMNDQESTNIPLSFIEDEYYILGSKSNRDCCVIV